MKVALVYDRVNKFGGAERVLLALHKIFPKAPLYTSVYSKETAKWADIFEVRTSFLQSASALRKYNELLALMMPVAFESFSFEEYDVVISITSESAKGILTGPNTLHVCYCLTPTRYLWSGYEEYFKSDLLKFLSKGSVSYLRKWDLVASSRPDYFIAISSEVKDRIKRYYGRKSEIIFPPLMLSKKTSKKKSKKEFFLLVSRLSRFSFYKRVDLAIDAFNETGLPLYVVGSGPMLSELKGRANKNIRFLGDLKDNELSFYYENCKALIFPGNEDFGLVMVEAQMHGKPVIAYKGGGALDIIEDGKTGTFFREQSKESLIRTLKSFDETIYNKADIVKSSRRFSFEIFRKDLLRFIEEKKNL
jgi:glycosyltransferase involved in cell wall biosynthesis